MIQRIHEVKVEIAIITEENQNEDANMFREGILIIKLTCMVQILGKLSILKKLMQGPQMHLLI